MFAVAKKDGIRLVINLEELNAVTVQDSSLPPNVNEFAESFLGYSLYGLLDLFSGFDARWVSVKSRPLQAFHTPIGPRQQTTIVQGFTNSVQEFQRCVKHGLKSVAEICDNFIDDCGVKGSSSRYNDEPISDNANIRQFVWEYVKNLDRVLGAMINTGVTASGIKAILAADRLRIVGTIVSLDGWIIQPSSVQKVLDWPLPESLSELRSFLGLAGVGRRWIKGYSLIAKPLTVLLRNPEESFEITTEAVEAFEELKLKISIAPVLIKLDYEAARAITPKPRASDEGLVVVGVDSSWAGAGWAVYQIRNGEKRPAIYGSCTFNETQQNYGQPKTEVYGVYRALRELRHRIWGIHFRLDHDAISLAKMLREPDDLPNAPLLRWVAWCRLFDFEPNHVPATQFKVEDALSRRRPSPEDPLMHFESEEEFEEAYLSLVYGSTNLTPRGSTVKSAFKYVLDSTFVSYSKANASGRTTHSQIPLLWSSQSILLPEVGSGGRISNIQEDLPFSLFHASSLCYVPEKGTRQLMEFFQRQTAVERWEEIRLGDELITLGYTEYETYSQSIPLDELQARPGHKHGTRDRDGDDYWTEIRLYLSTGRIPPEYSTNRAKLRFQIRANRFLLHNNRLWLIPKKKSALPRLVIEDSRRRSELMALAHNGHRGRDSSYKNLSERLYWPNMFDDVTYFVRSCIECQKSIRDQPVIPYNVSWQAPLLRHFNLDSIHMPKGVGGVEYIIHAIEPTILWVEAKALKDLTAKNVANFIYRYLICRFSCIPFVSIDGGPEFKKEVQTLLRTLYNCTIILSTPYHPEGNAPVERAHQPLVDAIFKCTGDAKGKWPLYLEPALFAIRVTVSRATGYAPYFLLYGVHPVFAFDIEEVTWQTLDWDKVRTHTELLAIRILQIQRRDPKMEEANEKLKETRRQAIEEWAKRHHYRFDFSEFEEGMYVWLRESQLDDTKGHKGEWTYSGPYVIHEKRENKSFVLRELSGAILQGHVNVRRLRLFFFRPENQTLRSSLDPRYRRTIQQSNPTFRLDFAKQVIAAERGVGTNSNMNVHNFDHFNGIPGRNSLSIPLCSRVE